MRKLIILVLSILMLCCSSALVACAGNPADEDHVHAYTDSVVNPTCTEKGFTLHVCECGEVVKDTFVDELGHSFGDVSYVWGGLNARQQGLVQLMKRILSRKR